MPIDESLAPTPALVMTVLDKIDWAMVGRSFSSTFSVSTVYCNILLYTRVNTIDRILHLTIADRKSNFNIML